MNTEDKMKMAELYYNEAKEKMESGQIVLAIKLYRDCLRLAPANEKYKISLADAYYKYANALLDGDDKNNDNNKIVSDSERAIAFLNDAIKLVKDNDEYQSTLAYAYYKVAYFSMPDEQKDDAETCLEKYDKAIKYFNEAYKIEPNDSLFKKSLADVYRRKARVYGNQEEYEKDIKCLEECLKLYPDNGYYLLEYGKALFKAGEPDKAIYYLKKLNNTDFWKRARFNIGKIYASLNNFKLAQTYFISILFDNQQILQGKKPKSIKASEDNLVLSTYLELGKLYTKFGFYREADICLEKCRQLDNSAQVIRYLIFLKIKEENYHDAYFYLRELVKFPDVKKDSVLNNLIFFIQQKLGINNNLINGDTYYCSQVTNYSEDETIDHMFNHYNNESRKSSFNSEVDIEQLYYEVKDKISNMCPDEITSADKYYINLGRIIGTYNGDLTSTICVVTIPNTKDIVTVYAVRNNRSLVNRYKERERQLQK